MDQYAGLVFLAIPLVLIYLVFSRARRQQRAAEQTQAQIRAGSQVMTTSGMFAEVVSSDGTTLVLQIAPGVHVTWLSRAIARVIEEDRPPDRDDEPTAT